MSMPSDQPVQGPATAATPQPYPPGVPGSTPGGVAGGVPAYLPPDPVLGGTPAAQGTPDDAMTLSREQLVSQTSWVRTGSVRLRRRIVTEQRTVSTQVQVRREELVIEGDGVEWDSNGVAVGRLPGDPVDPPAGPPPPLVIILREEIPQVVLTVRPYERVTATVTPVTGQAPVMAQLAHEEAVLESADAPAAPAYPADYPFTAAPADPSVAPPAGPALS